MPPVIGITPSPSLDTLAHGTFRRYTISSCYVAAISAAGGVPVVLPITPTHATDFLQIIDGLLLSGGGDIEPWRFGDANCHPATYGLDPERDDLELALSDGAMSRDLPILAICRGIQLLNVARGGTLVQHLAGRTDDPDSINHRQHEIDIPAHLSSHGVNLSPEWPLHLPFQHGSATIAVNSFHHQTIAQLGEGLQAVGFAPDGTIEAVINPNRPFILGVQWHPEMMFEADPIHLEPFRALVAAAETARLSPLSTATFSR